MGIESYRQHSKETITPGEKTKGFAVSGPLSLQGISTTDYFKSLRTPENQVAFLQKLGEGYDKVRYDPAKQKIMFGNNEVEEKAFISDHMNDRFFLMRKQEEREGKPVLTETPRIFMGTIDGMNRQPGWSRALNSIGGVLSKDSGNSAYWQSGVVITLTGTLNTDAPPGQPPGSIRQNVPVVQFHDHKINPKEFWLRTDYNTGAVDLKPEAVDFLVKFHKGELPMKLLKEMIIPLNLCLRAGSNMNCLM